MFRLGLISDTHGFLDARVARLLAGVNHIVHAGDVGSTDIIRKLEAIAPVTVVTGNCDSGLPYREIEVVQTGERKVIVQHIVDPRKLDLALQRRIDCEHPDAVVFGHTHRAFTQRVGKVLFVNPGYAGKPRFTLPRSIAVLSWRPSSKMDLEFLPLTEVE